MQDNASGDRSLPTPHRKWIELALHTVGLNCVPDNVMERTVSKPFWLNNKASLFEWDSVIIRTKIRNCLL